MKVEYEQLKIGKGIYTVSDISFILKMSKSRVRYWVNAYLREVLPGITNFRYNFNIEDGVFMTFNSLPRIFMFLKS